MNQNSQPEYLQLLSQLKLHDHVCLIYDEQEEQLFEIIPFMEIGLKRNEKCLYVADENSIAVVEGEMKKQDKEFFEHALNNKSLEMATKNESYLKDGTFSPEKMIELLTTLTESATKEGYNGFRGTGEMTWMLGDENVNPELVMKYEMQLNNFVQTHKACITCQYNRKKFSGKLLLQVFLTHPKIIYKKKVFENPIYYTNNEAIFSEELMAKILSDDKVFPL